MTAINPEISMVTAFAPATCANVAVGFDVLGFAIDAIGDQVTLVKRNDTEIVIEAIQSHEQLPLDIEKNTASVVIKKLCHDLQLPIGFSIQLHKGIALGSGMGGSAASAVAALVAANAFLKQPLSMNELAQYALLGEEVASGQAHADNVVPCVFGGLTLIRSSDPIDVIQLPIPNVFCVLVHPHYQLSTKKSRKVLRSTVSLKKYVAQSANLAAFIVALYKQDIALLKKSTIDILIEPQRAALVPGFYAVKNAALQAGALAVSLSGSGPSLFALVESKYDAEAVRVAMCNKFEDNGLRSDSWITQINQCRAHVISKETIA